MTVADLLTSQRRWGHTRCRKFLQAVPMSENKTVGSMTDRQRRALATMLADGGAERPTGARRRERSSPRWPPSPEARGDLAPGEGVRPAGAVPPPRGAGQAAAAISTMCPSGSRR